MRRLQMQQLMAVAALTMAVSHVEIPKSMRTVTPAKPPRPRPPDTTADRAISEWNAIVEQRKAEKRARKAARSKT